MQQGQKVDGLFTTVIVSGESKVYTLGDIPHVPVHVIDFLEGSGK